MLKYKDKIMVIFVNMPKNMIRRAPEKITVRSFKRHPQNSSYMNLYRIFGDLGVVVGVNFKRILKGISEKKRHNVYSFSQRYP